MTGRSRRTATSTSNFGVGRRESHDATDFYARFQAPEIAMGDDLGRVDIIEPCIEGDARHMAELPDNSVALVVTSPPYFAGKEYEEALGEGHTPATYLEFLQMLRDVFAECKRVLEPGGRIAVNVANLGRKPYRSLSSDVIRILQDDLRLLLRGEVIWRKGEGASSSCAWGSFRSAANPVLRDVTERVVIASKGRFDRARTIEERREQGFPNENLITADEFMEATLDVWNIAPESARRVNHPAPFPVELPQRLIDLYTYRDDLVLDPFMGSGSTLVAAVRTDRRCVGYDTDPEYVGQARLRLAEEQRRRAQLRVVRDRPAAVRRPEPEMSEDEIAALISDPPDDFQARASREGKAAQAIAQGTLEAAGFTVIDKNARMKGLGVTVNFIGLDADGVPWYFDVSGAFTTTRGGLLRTDTLWRSLGRANVLVHKDLTPIVLLTSHLPKRRSEGDLALRAVGPAVVFDAIEMLSDAGMDRLRLYATGGQHRTPAVGFWTDKDLKECPGP